MRLSVFCAFLLIATAGVFAADGLPRPRLGHSVWLGPGCDQIVEMDDFYEMVGGLIVDSGVRLQEPGDKLELECFGKLSRVGPAYKAYATARVTITRAVPYKGQQGRMLLNRETYGVELEAASVAGLREPFRKALRKTLKDSLAAYAKGRYAEVMPPAPRRTTTAKR